MLLLTTLIRSTCEGKLAHYSSTFRFPHQPWLYISHSLFCLFLLRIRRIHMIFLSINTRLCSHYAPRVTYTPHWWANLGLGLIFNTLDSEWIDPKGDITMYKFLSLVLSFCLTVFILFLVCTYIHTRVHVSFYVQWLWEKVWVLFIGIRVTKYIFALLDKNYFNGKAVLNSAVWKS